MIYEILDETLTKLEEYKKTNPDEIKYRRITFDNLKTQLNVFKGHWTQPSMSQLEQLEKLQIDC